MHSLQIGRHFLSPQKLFINYRKSTVPEGGWTNEHFAGPNGVMLVRDLQAAQNAAKIKGARLLTAPLTKVMRDQVRNVLSIMESKLNRSYPGFRSWGGKAALNHTTIRLSNGQHEDLWAAAIEEAFAQEGHTVLATVRGPLQSVADDVLDKTTTLLSSTKPAAGVRRTLQLDLNEMSQQVTNINETTRKNLSRIIKKAIDDGEHPFAVMELVRNKIPQIATNRVPTIVRTEMGRAVDRATIISMKAGGQVTHVSVIGCQAIEKGSPTYNGVPTCNIKNVPIEFSSSLRFHPNHTGAIVASGFKKNDGGRPDLPLRQGGDNGTWEDRGRPVPAVSNEPVPGPPGGAPPPRPPRPVPTPVPTPPAPKPLPPVHDPVLTPEPPSQALMPPYHPNNAAPRWSSWASPSEMDSSLSLFEMDALDSVIDNEWPIITALREASPLDQTTRNHLALIDEIFDAAPVAPAGTRLRTVMVADDFDTMFGGEKTWVDKGFGLASKDGQGSMFQTINLTDEGYVLSELLDVHIELDGKALPVWGHAANSDPSRLRYQEMMIPRGSHYALVRREGRDLYLKVTTPGRAIVAPAVEIPKPVAAVPTAAAVTKAKMSVPRNKVGHLTTEWKAPATQAEMTAFANQMTGDNFEVMISDKNGYFISFHNLPDELQEAKDALTLFHKEVGMSPIELRDHVLSRMDKSIYGKVDCSINLDDARKTLHLNMYIRMNDGTGRIHLERKFRVENGVRKVHHDYLTIPDAHQGTNIAKQISESMLEIYDHLDIKVIDMLANISVGGYSWARYGFLPKSENEWKYLRQSVVSRWNKMKIQSDGISSAFVDQMTSEQIAEIDAIMDKVAQSNDVLTIRTVAGLRHPVSRLVPDPDLPELTVGKKLLLGTSWNSEIALHSADEYANYRIYIQKQKGGE